MNGRRFHSKPKYGRISWKREIGSDEVDVDERAQERVGELAEVDRQPAVELQVGGVRVLVRAAAADGRGRRCRWRSGS